MVQKAPVGGQCFVDVRGEGADEGIRQHDAAHEVAHAYQDAEGDRAYRARRSIAEPLAGFAPWFSFCLIGGPWFGVPALVLLALVYAAGLVVFAFATLPVEIGASGKALAFVNNLGMSGERHTGARDVLKAAAWTYVAGALTALLTFVYYAWLVFGRRD